MCVWEMRKQYRKPKRKSRGILLPFGKFVLVACFYKSSFSYYMSHKPTTFYRKKNKYKKSYILRIHKFISTFLFIENRYFVLRRREWNNQENIPNQSSNVKRVVHNFTNHPTVIRLCRCSVEKVRQEGGNYVQKRIIWFDSFVCPNNCSSTQY